MFVDIETPKTPLKITNILTAYDKGVVVKGVRQPPKKLTPEVCFDILKSTNYPRCIRDMLQLIAKLPDEEQAQFKEVVLSCFDNREQPEPIFQLGQEIAEKSGYGIEFAKLQKMKEGPYLFSEVDARKCEVREDAYFEYEDFSAYDKVMFLSDKKIQFGRDVKFPKNMEFPNSPDVSLTRPFEAYNFTGVQSIRFKNGAKVNLSDAYNLPANLDISMCDEVNLGNCDLSEQPNLRFKDGAKVNLKGAENLPANLDVSQCPEVNLSECDLKGQPNLRFKEGATVSLYNAKNLPANMDFSQCAGVYLGKCDLKGQPNLRFKDGAKVNLTRALFLLENIDFSMCDEVKLCHCDLSEQPNLCFKEGAKVYLNGAENLPANLDFSMCSEVNLDGCDLSEQPNLCFKNGAKVSLTAYNLPANLDFSMCDEVDLHYCNLRRVQKLVFKNRKQMEKSGAELPYKWEGKLVFADEQREADLNLAMTAKAKGGR